MKTSQSNTQSEGQDKGEEVQSLLKVKKPSSMRPGLNAVQGCTWPKVQQMRLRQSMTAFIRRA